MKPDINALMRFPVFADFSGTELGAIADELTVVELGPGEVLFNEGDDGDACYFLHLGKMLIDRETVPHQHEPLAELKAPNLLGEMSIIRNAPRSARAVAIQASVLWEMKAATLDHLADQGSVASYKVMRWMARNVGDRLSATNDKLIEIYAKPYKSIMELKQRIGELRPGLVSVGFGDTDDLEDGL